MLKYLNITDLIVCNESLLLCVRIGATNHKSTYTTHNCNHTQDHFWNIDDIERYILPAPIYIIN